MLRVIGSLSECTLKPYRRGKLEKMVFIAKVRTELPLDTTYVAELKEERVETQFTNPNMSGIAVSAVGTISSARPHDAELLLLKPEENQKVYLTLSFDYPTEITAEQVSDLARMCVEPDAPLSLEVLRYSPQTTLFDEAPDDEYTEGFEGVIALAEAEA